MPEVYSFIYLFSYVFIYSFITNHALPFKCGFEFHVDTPYTFVVTIFSCLILVKYEALL